MTPAATTAGIPVDRSDAGVEKGDDADHNRWHVQPGCVDSDRGHDEHHGLDGEHTGGRQMEV
jgi:hypothetical protein